MGTISEDDEPLQSCVQDTALDSVRVGLTVNDTHEEAVVTLEKDDTAWWSVDRGRSPPLHTGRFASLSEDLQQGRVEEGPDAHCERETESDAESCE